ADGRHAVVDGGAGEPRQRTLQLLVAEFLLGAREQPLDDAPPEPGILLADRGPRRAADRRPGLAGDDDRLPGGGRRELRPRSEDLDLVAVGELGDERRDLAVDLAAHRGVADI